MRSRVRPVRIVCGGCFGPHTGETCPVLAAERRKAFDPWVDLEWEQHPEAMRIIEDHPDGMTLEAIGAAMGITRERVRQIEASALLKLRGECGDDVATIAGVPISVPDCESCARPFVRKRGRDRHCDECIASAASELEQTA